MEFQLYYEPSLNIYNQYPGNYSSYSLNQKIDAKVEGWGAKVGALLSFWGGGRLGVTADIPTVYLVNEDYSGSDILEYDDGYIDETHYEPGNWSYQIYYPWKYSFGLAWVALHPSYEKVGWRTQLFASRTSQQLVI